MAQDWYTADTAATGALSNASLGEPLPPRPAGYDLRPLSLGEILDRTFSVYRSHFALFAGMTAIYALFALTLQLVNLFVKHEVIRHFGFQAGAPSEALGSALIGLILLLPAAVMQAGTVFAVSEVYLGRPMTALNALRATAGKWYRYIAIAFWLSWSILWLPVAISIPATIVLVGFRNSGLLWLAVLLFFLAACAIPYGIWAGLRNGLAVQVTVIEAQTVRASMRRSKVLTIGAKWRMIVIGLILAVLASVVSMLQLPMLLLVAKAPLQEHMVAQAISLLINAASQTVVTPVGLIGMSLLYFDQRVRQEAFDLLLLLGPEPPVPPAMPVVPFAETSLDPADPIGDDGRI